RNLHEMLSRAQDALNGAKARRRGSFQAYRPDLERAAQRQANVHATGEIVTALNARRIFLVYEPIVAISSRRPVLYECLMRIKRADGTLLAVNDMGPVAARLGLVRPPRQPVFGLPLPEVGAAPALEGGV